MKKYLTAFLTVASFVVGASGQTVTPADDSRWGLVDISVACVRAKPSHASEQTTQALCGTPVKVGRRSGDWYEVELPDGYRGQINRANVTLLSESRMSQWRRSRRVIVTVPGTTDVLADTLAGAGGRRVAELVEGAVVAALSDGGRYVRVGLPGGRAEGYVEKRSVADFEKWASVAPDASVILSTASAMVGSPYVWGGLTSKGPDCSGLVKAAYWQSGLILRRDASQQALTGQDVSIANPTEWAAADLLFFAGSDGVRITHVAIHIDGGRYIHSSGRVGYGSIHPGDADYVGRKVVKVRRILGSELTPGITPVKNHKWYFE